jgi:hypothetical protein
MPRRSVVKIKLSSVGLFRKRSPNFADSPNSPFHNQTSCFARDLFEVAAWVISFYLVHAQCRGESVSAKVLKSLPGCQASHHAPFLPRNLFTVTFVTRPALHA